MRNGGAGRGRREWPIVGVALRHEADVVLVRQRARLIAELLGFGKVDQTRIATATSEVARNALEHGGGGRADFAVSTAPPAALVVRVRDSGPGLSLDELPAAASERLEAGTGLLLTRRLMDGFAVESPPDGGTLVALAKHLPPRAVDELVPERLRGLVAELARRPPESLLEELQQQQQELLAVLEDLTARQEALTAANQELEETNRGVMALYADVTQELDETNRGVVALYAQLDDQAQRLREVDALKDRFISYLSHEFRTPLHSMLSLARLLVEQADGPLNDEQRTQVGLIRGSAVDLLQMVDDLLDLAKIQAGKLAVQRQPIAVEELFAALRGMFRPLAAEAGLELRFEEEPGLPPLFTDPQKVSQILRNLIGNAIKFTPAGEVRVAAAAEGTGTLRVDVADTGPGIPAEARERIFQEYEQIGGGAEARARGTGLGLPLSRRLAALLAGELSVASRPGEGSTFTLRLPFGEVPGGDAPAEGEGAAPAAAGRAETAAAPATAPLALVVDDDPGVRYLLRRRLQEIGWRSAAAADGDQALASARAEPCDLVVLDLKLPTISGFEVLAALAADERLRDLPVVVFTSKAL
ncbi:MAG TPA: ATP-binding protein, partial [Thermoanaerobaculia bacterium]